MTILARAAVCLLVLALVGCAKPPPPTAAITEYGIYDAKITTDGDWKLGTPVGVSSVSELHFLTMTTSIPCKNGIYWGIRVRASNPTLYKHIHLKVTVTHPPFTSPDGKTSTGDTLEETIVSPNTTYETHCLWFFLDSCPFEYVPGEWIMTVEFDDRVVDSKTFEMYKP